MEGKEGFDKLNPAEMEGRKEWKELLPFFHSSLTEPNGRVQPRCGA
jgi:hypothetical protein